MREERRTLVERVAQIRTGGGPAERTEPRAPEAPRRLEAPAANGHNGNGSAAAEKKIRTRAPRRCRPPQNCPKPARYLTSAVGLGCSTASPVWPRADRARRHETHPAQCGVGSRRNRLSRVTRQERFGLKAIADLRARLRKLSSCTIF